MVAVAVVNKKTLVDLTLFQMRFLNHYVYLYYFKKSQDGSATSSFS